MKSSEDLGKAIQKKLRSIKKATVGFEQLEIWGEDLLLTEIKAMVE